MGTLTDPLRAERKRPRGTFTIHGPIAKAEAVV